MIVAGTGPRSVVTTASYEARRFGVGSAMPAARARRLCPQGVYLAPDFAYYREASRAVMALVRAAVDTVEVVGPRRGLSRPVRPLRPGARPCDGWRGRSSGRPASAARSASGRASSWRRWPPMPRSPRGFVVLTPRAGLRSGSDPRRAGSYRESVPRPSSACARSASTRWPRWPRRRPIGSQRASGLDSRPSFSAGPGSRTNPPVTEERKVVSESREVTFDEDIRDPERLEAILAELVERLVRGRSWPRADGAGRSASRSGSTTSPPTHAPARLPRPSRRPTGWDRWRWSSCGGSRPRGRSACSACGSRASNWAIAPTTSNSSWFSSAGWPLAGAQWPGVRGSSRGGQEAAARRRQ